MALQSSAECNDVNGCLGQRRRSSEEGTCQEHLKSRLWHRSGPRDSREMQISTTTEATKRGLIVFRQDLSSHLFPAAHSSRTCADTLRRLMCLEVSLKMCKGSFAGRVEVLHVLRNLAMTPIKAIRLRNTAGSSLWYPRSDQKVSRSSCAPPSASAGISKPSCTIKHQLSFSPIASRPKSTLTSVEYSIA